MREEYEKGWSVKDIFPVNVLGFQTHRDHFAIGYDEKAVRERINALRGTKLTDDEIRTVYKLTDNRDWQVNAARSRVRADKDWEAAFTDCLYRPFDVRPCYFSDVAMDYTRKELARNTLRQVNISLLVPRQLSTAPYSHVLCANIPAESCAVSNNTKEQNYVFPLYIYPTEQEKQFGIERHANIAPTFVKALTERLGHEATPEETFGYLYGVLHSPTYRERYGDLLKRDFPRIPLPPERTLFADMAGVGQRLVALHLLEDPMLLAHAPGFPHGGPNTVDKMKADNRYKGGRIHLNDAQYFDNVTKDVWNFRVGGYQPAAKWLDDRAGRTLSDDDLTHYRKLLAALKQTLALMDSADSVFSLILTARATE